MLTKKVTFIGGGNMAEGIIRGMVQEKAVEPAMIQVYDIIPARLTYLTDKYGVTTFSDVQPAISDAAIVVIAVRPQDAAGVLATLKQNNKAGQLIVSICAGITIEKMQTALNPGAEIARVMPNVLSDAQHGYTGICLSADVTEEDKADLTTIFNALGQTTFIPESQFDAFTAFSCAGPAYIMACISGLIDAGVQSGFSRKTSRDMVLENFIGSGLALKQSGEHPFVRMDQMTSPAGCSIDGVASLQKAGLTGILMEAVKVALKRTQEL